MIQDIELTRHAAARMRQRSLRDADVNLVFAAASQRHGDTYLLTDSDADREIAKLKRQIQHIERLRGTVLVVSGGKLVTCYHASKPRRRTGWAGRGSTNGF